MKRLLLSSLLLAGSLHAEVKLPAIFTDHLVLQREKPVAIWGWADAGEDVTVEFGKQSKKATADKEGAWKVTLDALQTSSTPTELIIKGKNTITLSDILVGEVWVCSGQSNMQFQVSHAVNGEKEAGDAKFPNIRLFSVPRTVADAPIKDVQPGPGQPVTGWAAATDPKVVGDFSAVAYFFGRELNQKLDIPIGLIHTSWGGTRAEAWTSLPALEAVTTCKAIIAGWAEMLKTYDPVKDKEKHDTAVATIKEKIAKIKEENAQPGATPKVLPNAPRAWEDQTKSQHRPAVLYNAMISPLIPYGLRGAIWYQGESNSTRAAQYQTLLPTMIKDWRKRWGSDFSFYIVQLAGFAHGKQHPAPVGDADDWAELQWTQLQTAIKPKFNSGLAVTNDIGEETDIHPKNKQEVGHRLALQALSKDYKMKDIISGGPIFAGGTTEGEKFVINFSNGAGLKSRDGGELKGFIICGEDKVWKPAKAKVFAGRPQVHVWNSEIKKPLAVRYAWESWCPEANLVNKEGLPASLFRTDSFELSTKGNENPFAPAKAAAPAKAKDDVKKAVPVGEQPKKKAA
jgi:sialate O-acetylesterase